MAEIYEGGESLPASAYTDARNQVLGTVSHRLSEAAIYANLDSDLVAAHWVGSAVVDVGMEGIPSLESAQVNMRLWHHLHSGEVGVRVALRGSTLKISRVYNKLNEAVTIPQLRSAVSPREDSLVAQALAKATFNPESARKHAEQLFLQKYTRGRLPRRAG